MDSRREVKTEAQLCFFQFQMQKSLSRNTRWEAQEVTSAGPLLQRQATSEGDRIIFNKFIHNISLWL